MWTCPDWSLGLGVRGLDFSSDGALTGCLHLSMAGECNLWAGSGSRLLVLIEPELSRRPNKTRARFGFWSGSCADQTGASLGLGVARGL